MSAAPVELICIDLGTTNTRVWKINADCRILAKAQAQVGVRDTARENSSALLRQTLGKLLREVSGERTSTPIIAAGMITSGLGLLEIPHLPAPAGLADLAAATRAHSFPDICPEPIHLVPGVRCGHGVNGDMMRGEETLSLGLLALEIAAVPATILNLGSHWKLIQIDCNAQIAAASTTLSGEMIHAIHTTTILSSALPRQRPEELNKSWISAGMKQQRTTGLPHALFRVRMLQLENKTTPEERLAYLLGAFIAADLDPLLAQKTITRDSTLLIAGNNAFAAGWQFALSEIGANGIVLADDQIEHSMLIGLSHIYGKRD